MPATMRKKKQPPRKRTKEKREKKNKVSVDKTSEAFRSKSLEFGGFLDEMIQWFSDHQQQADQHFSLRDAARSGSVSLKDFELGLMNLGVLRPHFQIRLLAELLETNNNMINYEDLSRQVQGLRMSHSSTGVDTQVSGNVSCLNRSAQDQLLKMDEDRFIRLSVRLIPFESSVRHPGNFDVVLSSRSRVFSLIRIIQDRVGIQTFRLEVFRSRALTKETRLPPESSLEECGFKGGSEESPPGDTVYYDYTLVLTDCPVLNCDHYFRSKPDTSAKRTGPQ